MVWLRLTAGTTYQNRKSTGRVNQRKSRRPRERNPPDIT